MGVCFLGLLLVFFLPFYSRMVCFFVVLVLVLYVLRQEIGQEERLRSNLFCVHWDINLNSVNQSISDCLLKEGQLSVNIGSDTDRGIATGWTQVDMTSLFLIWL